MTRRIRTCIGCGGQFEKSALARIVRDPDGEIRYDRTGRAAGRGAYVCSEECLRNAVEKRKLSRAFKSESVRTDVEALAREMRAALDSEAR